MRGGFFTKVFVLYLVVFLSAILFAERYMAGVVRDSYVNSLQNNLTTEARLIIPSVDFNRSHVDIQAADIKNRTGARITLIARDGFVLGDSDADSSAMENHINRPEVQQALVEGVGHSIRYSNTIKEHLLYTAVAVTGGDEVVGFVRLAIPLTEASASIKNIRLRIAMGVIAVFVIVGIVSLIQFGRLQKLVKDVSAFSSSIAHGNFDERLMLSGLGEFENIAGNLNSMAEDLKGLIERDREKFEQLSIIMKSVPDIMFILDPTDRVMMVNKAAEGFLRHTVPMGKPMRDVFRDPVLISLIRDARKSGAIEEAELEPDEPGGRYYIAKAAPVSITGGQLSGMVVLLHDITGARNIEQVRKDFVANVSHELKTPIAAIKGFADTLAQGALEDKENAPRFVGIIRSNSDRMVKLVEDLMVLSRIELGVITPDMQEVNLYDVMTKTMESFQLMADKKGVRLAVDIKDRSSSIKADHDRLVQILSNLVDNALKYTDEGAITAGEGNDDGRRFLFVSDTGIGISEKHLSRLGQRFYRVDTSRSRQLGGTGLGLAIVKHLVAAHGWRMEFRSTLGRGTTVKILIQPPPGQP